MLSASHSPQTLPGNVQPAECMCRYVYVCEEGILIIVTTTRTTGQLSCISLGSITAAYHKFLIKHTFTVLVYKAYHFLGVYTGALSLAPLLDFSIVTKDIFHFGRVDCK